MMPENIRQCIMKSSREDQESSSIFETHLITSFDMGGAGDELVKPLFGQESERKGHFSISTALLCI